MRAREFLPQLADAARPARHRGRRRRSWLIALGLIKKVAIADFLARTVVDPVFARARRPTARPTSRSPSYGYAAQIYCDFSGYTDIAIGAALLMGFVFPQNFDRPYAALGFQRVLAALAHDAVAVPARLPLHPAGRQPRAASCSRPAT